MPELPEVETVMRGIAPFMEGQRINRLELRRAGLRWPFAPDLAQRAEGQRITSLTRRAKYILIALEQQDQLLLHLGMSGRMRITLPDGAPDEAPSQAQTVFYHPHGAYEAHDHVIFHLETGARVILNDARRFGMLEIFASDAPPPFLRDLGVEPLGNSLNGPWLHARLATRKSPLKALLLDQKIIAGLGNIYVCEALYGSGLSPMRLGCDLRADEAGALVQSIRDVLRRAIEAGGSSLRDHRQADGSLGYFQHNFAVYGRAGESCLKPGCGGKIQRLVQSGRSSFYCPGCQS